MMDKLLSAILILAILGAIGALGYVITHPVEENFSEFYILGLEGKAEGYPKQLAVGEQGKVILGIVNQEHEPMEYKVELRVGGALAEEIGPINLVHAEKWEETVGFVPQEPGAKQKVEFILHKIRQLGENKETGLSLWLGRENLDATVTNQSQTTATYEIEVRVKARLGEDEEEKEETSRRSTGTATLNPGEKWAEQFDYLYPGAVWQNAELFLYRDGELIYTEDALGGYPALHLWIEVN